MSQGLALYDAQGHLTYSTDDVTWNLVDGFLVSANTTVSKTYPEAVGMTLAAMRWFVNDIPGDQSAIVANPVFSGNSITASGGTFDTYVMVFAQ